MNLHIFNICLHSSFGQNAFNWTPVIFFMSDHTNGEVLFLPTLNEIEASGRKDGSLKAHLLGDLAAAFLLINFI